MIIFNVTMVFILESNCASAVRLHQQWMSKRAKEKLQCFSQLHPHCDVSEALCQNRQTSILSVKSTHQESHLECHNLIHFKCSSSCLLKRCPLDSRDRKLKAKWITGRQNQDGPLESALECENSQSTYNHKSVNGSVKHHFRNYL